jgi:branched-chain amino acid transport system ATP-binding protein
MEVVMQVCERLYVMHHGALLASGTPAEIQSNRQVVSVYLGGEL